MHVDLSEFSELPGCYIRQAETVKNELLTTDVIGSYKDSKSLSDFVASLDEYISKNGVICYHYTRATAQDIISNGLLVRQGYEIRNQFIRQHGHKFTCNQVRRLEKAWHDFFGCDQNVRNGKIYFLTQKYNQSQWEMAEVADLMGLYGGEQISMPITQEIELNDIYQIMSTLGEPLIIKCRLQKSTLATNNGNSYGEVLLSSYHSSINQAASPINIDLHTIQNVPPEAIEVINFRE